MHPVARYTYMYMCACACACACVCVCVLYRMEFFMHVRYFGVLCPVPLKVRLTVVAELWLMIVQINMTSCGLVARFPGYRSRGPGSIPSPTRFSEK
jgi:hypothetical protein